MITIDGGTGVITSTNRLQLPANSGGPGNILQVKQANTDDNHTSTSSSYQNVDELNCAITPISSTSLLIYHYSLQMRVYENNSHDARAWIAISDDAGSSYLAENYHRSYDYGASGSLIDIGVSGYAIKTAGSTSARTYYIYTKLQNGDAYEVNPAASQNISAVTIMEVAV